MTIAKTLMELGSVAGIGKAVQGLRHLDADDLLGALGLERHRSLTERIVPAVILIAISAAIGAGTALLLAPSSGTELRRRVQSRAAEAKARIVRKVDGHGQSAG